MTVHPEHRSRAAKRQAAAAGPSPQPAPAAARTTATVRTRRRRGRAAPAAAAASADPLAMLAALLRAAARAAPDPGTRSWLLRLLEHGEFVSSEDLRP
jgi:hypothetical protein